MSVDTVIAGTPDPALIDWAMFGGSDFVVPILWSKAGVPVNLVAASVTVEFSAAPTGGVVPRTITSAGANAEGATVVCADGTGLANMTVTIPAAATAAYRFSNIRYVMWVTYPGSGTLRWAEGGVTYEDGP